MPAKPPRAQASLEKEANRMEGYPHIHSKFYKDIRHQVRSGDILLCAGSSPFSTLIQKATNSVWSHVAFILRVDAIDRIMVLESVESVGVRTIPLSSYVRDYNATSKGYPGRVMLARHNEIKTKSMAKFSRSAINFLGYPYGTDEIVRIATRISMHALGLHTLEPEHSKKREFICSEYAYACFKSVGVHINPQRAGFITPADFALSPEIKPICFIETECLSTYSMPAFSMPG